MILTTFSLVAMGLLAIFASSYVHAFQSYGDGFLFLKKQMLAVLIGSVLFLLVSQVPVRLISKNVLPAVFLTILFLLLVLVPGITHEAKGAARWFRVFGFSIQPVEWAKLVFIVFLAKNLSRQSFDIQDKKSIFFSSLGIFLMFCTLFMLQPDFGNSVILLSILAAMLFVAGIQARWILFGTLSGILFVGIAIWSAPYRFARITGFLNPFENVGTSGFQIIQSFLGFQNGGITGAGLGESKQKLFYLPEAHTDFIFSVIAEELGMLGVLGLILLFMNYFFLGLKIAAKITPLFEKFLVFGISFMVLFQASINLGVVLGLLPTKGITLPFISYGSNSLLVLFVGTAIISKICLEHHQRPSHQC